MTMTMETLYASRQLFWQKVRNNAEARTWCSGIVQFRLYMRMFGIDTQATTDKSICAMLVIPFLYQGEEMKVLCEAIESNV